MTNPTKKVRIAALADIHVTERSHTKYQNIFREISSNADVMVLCGDLTDHGLATEAEILRDELQACTIPKVAVLGNHDFENNQDKQIKQILRAGNLILLEDEEYIYEAVGFAGVKGFGGGFGRHMVGAFGEHAMKDFVEETIREVEKLENGLNKIDHAEKKVVLMHYSPIPTTLQGEPPEIYPFLGCSRFEEVINRYDVSVVFHGHAHYGSPEGKTSTNIPVYNVAYSLLENQKEPLQYKLVTL